MSESNEKTYTAAQMREAYVRGARQWGAYVDDAQTRAREAYPDPEPERRWVDAGGTDYARAADGRWWVRSIDGTPQPSWLSDKAVLALASLLPRVPVTVTEAQKKMPRALLGALVLWAKAPSFSEADRIWHCEVCPTYASALSAVAADLAQPAFGCQHKPSRWLVRDNRGAETSVLGSKDDVRHVADKFDRDDPDYAPHRVVALAEVEQG